MWPERLIAALGHDKDAGVRHALELLETLRESDRFDGVHLVPSARRYFTRTLSASVAVPVPGATRGVA
jgi:hypothetical protein